MRDPGAALGDRDRVADGHADSSAPDQLRYSDQNGYTVPRTCPDHRQGICSQPNYSLQRKAVFHCHRLCLARQALSPQAHRVGHVRRGLDDVFARRGQEVGIVGLVNQHLLPELVQHRLAQDCRLKCVITRRLERDPLEMADVYTVHAVQRTAHLVADHG